MLSGRTQRSGMAAMFSHRKLGAESEPESVTRKLGSGPGGWSGEGLRRGFVAAGLSRKAQGNRKAKADEHQIAGCPDPGLVTSGKDPFQQEWIGQQSEHRAGVGKGVETVGGGKDFGLGGPALQQRTGGANDEEREGDCDAEQSQY